MSAGAFLRVRALEFHLRRGTLRTGQVRQQIAELCFRRELARLRADGVNLLRNFYVPETSPVTQVPESKSILCLSDECCCRCSCAETVDAF